MTSIIRLPEDLSNQIAAGEVVERPASVVKELIENSVDAGATRVQIDVGAGGVSLIRVSDDGCGMDEADARLAVERHATSKIRRIDDLLALGTFGFRGEALPSIASVSRFTVRTRTRDADAGTEVTVEGGGSAVVGPCGMAPGTVIEIRDLFFNVPARRKFLKSVSAEAAAITATVESLALTAPQLTFVLTRDGRPVRQWLRSADRGERVAAVHDDEVLARIEGERGPLRIEAWLSPPEAARSGAAGLTLLVNHRVIRDRVLHRVIAHAYGSVLESGRYPIGVVYLDIDPGLVDVNVHPQKAEVRFADTRAVHDTVHSVLSHGLAGAFGLAGSRGAPLRGPAPAPAVPWTPPVAPSSQPVAATPPTFSSAPVLARSAPFAAAGVATSSPTQPEPDPWGLAPEPEPAGPSAHQELLPLGLPQQKTSSARYGGLRFLAQARNTFLICESATGLVIIDQHAAAERVNFARLRASFLARRVASQRLLLPSTVRVDAAQAEFLEASQELVQSMGFELRVVGPAAAVVSAVPQIVSRAAPERLAMDLIDELTRAGGRDLSGAIDLVLATMACHGSVRAGDAMTGEQAVALLAALDEVDHGGHCPHGRPLLMEIGFQELERQVARR
ncbi:MAG TPA: DNA mismatch repair endonuclease MutL [Polyangiaceae bacterium]|nr:DNA mismatch repair endonuclease MutL [Polyangiaceae bacterium]